MNSEKCEYIQNMKYKLITNEKLNPADIHTIIAALSESKECFQEPYYELVYHDKYDRIERRVMTPVRSYTFKTDEIGVVIKEETFDFKFRRVVREEDNE